jgi:hypothetical protein
MISAKRPTACVTGQWAGVESAWQQEKTEARKMLENGDESHVSSARCVGWRYERKTRLLKKVTIANWSTDFDSNFLLLSPNSNEDEKQSKIDDTAHGEHT